MNFERTSPRRTLSKHDRNLRQNETEESIEENIETVEECELMFNDIDRVLEKYFPEEFKNFNRPEQWRYHRTYEAALNHFYAESGWDKNTKDYYNESAFLAASAIRYIDDFIDETLWPSLGRAKKPPQKFAKRFDDFLQAAHEAVVLYVPDLPPDIVNLPKLEMKLTLFPDQDTFEQEFTHLFEYKSFDLAYLFEKIFGRDITQEDVDRFRRHSLKDVLRDFENYDHETSTDFNLYNHLLDNKLDPSVLIEYLESEFQTDAPNYYNLYQHGKLNASSELSKEAQAEINRDNYYIYRMKNALDKLRDLPSSSAEAA